MIKFILVILLFFGLMVLLLGFSVIRSLKSLFFGSSSPSSKQRQHSSQREHQKRTSYTQQSYNMTRKKLFEKDEGEYVDYEDVKE